MDEPVLIAEIGCNHKGDLDVALQFLDVASAFCQVGHVKFQKRDNRTLLPPEQYDAPHPVPDNSFGGCYGDHREALELSVEQHRKLKDACEERGLTYSTSVWDLPSFEAIAELEPTYLKVPSATNTNAALLQAMADRFAGQIHISLGMTTRAEEEAIVSLLDRAGRLGDVVLYACTSGYPIQASEAFLLEIPRLRQAYGDRVHAIGYSGHHNGISLDVAAYTLGATYIERHFTLDRTWKGTDHAASLEPDGLRRLQRDLLHAHEALRARPEEIVDVERPQRAKLKWTGDA